MLYPIFMVCSCFLCGYFPDLTDSRNVFFQSFVFALRESQVNTVWTATKQSQNFEVKITCGHSFTRETNCQGRSQRTLQQPGSGLVSFPYITFLRPLQFQPLEALQSLMVGVYILVSELILVSSLFQSIFPQEFLLGNGQKVTLYFTVSPLKIIHV